MDEIANGKLSKVELLSQFYNKFKTLIDNAYEKMENLKPKPQKTDIICDKCDAPMVVREGRFGKFLACSNYPECKFTVRGIIKNETCPQCGYTLFIKKDGWHCARKACGYKEEDT